MKDYFYSASSLVSGNSVKVLASGEEIFPHLLALIEAAKFRIWFQTYQFESDRTGQMVLDALVDAQKRGIEVRVMVDAIGSIFTKSKFFEPLVKVGGSLKYYHHLTPLKLDWKIFKRNHRKILLVDAEKVLIGGYNVSNEYLVSPVYGGMFDMAVLVEGPASSQASDLFEWSWQGPARLRKIGGREQRSKPRDNSGIHEVSVVGNDHFLDRWKIRRELLYCISQAKKSVLVMNPYFLPDPAVIRFLSSAAIRGVKVKIILPSYTDVTLIDLASIEVQRRLIELGIEIYKWPGFLHAKMMIVDDLLVSIGSFNFDYRSLFHNLEVAVHIADDTLGKQVSEVFERECEKSKRVSLSTIKSRSLLSRIASTLAYRLRALL